MVVMRDKRMPTSQDPHHRDPRATRYYDEKMPRHKSKVPGSQAEGDGEGSRPKHRSMTSRPHERGKERDSIPPYYRSRSGHVSKLMSADEAQNAIHTLFMLVKKAVAFFVNFKEEYQQDVHGIEAYAGQTILEKLWERKIRHNDSQSYPSKGRSKGDDVGSRSAFFSDVSSRLWDGLNDAYEGVRSNPSAQNDSLARKLDNAIKEFGKLLMSVRTESQEMDHLIQESRELKAVLELRGAGKVSKDDKENRQPRDRGAAQGHMRGSSLGGEDTQYGRSEEHSGSEDNGDEDEHGEQSGEKEGSEAGGGEGDQGLSLPDLSMYLKANE